MIATPRLKLPSWRPAPVAAARARPVLALAALGLVLLVAIAVVAMLISPRAGVRLPLAAALAQAPAGWAKALHPAHGEVHPGEAIIRLWDRPPSAAVAGAPLRAPPVAWAGAGPLPPAPIAGLFVNGPGGPLPIIAADGRTPFEAYRRPFAADPRPKLALVVRGLGLNAQATRVAIETLPPQVTLSFAVYADGLQDWIDLARSRGHEVLLDAPMEPMDYPDNDPGPYTLMAQAQPQQTVQKLEWVLSRATGYFGVTNYLGERFLGSPAAAATLGAALRGRGLAFIDDGLARDRAGGPPRVSATAVVDASPTPEAIDRQLQVLESGARAQGQALGMASPYPLTLDRIGRWSEGLADRGFSLVPASALASHK